jgi:hypothetical protein
MNTLTKILHSLVLLSLLSSCATMVSIDATPKEVADMATKIANFDIPKGYQPEFSTSLNGYIVVSYNPGDGHSHLYLIQSDNEDDGEKLSNMLDQIAPGSYDPQTRMTVLETVPVSVRGQEETLVISEGTTSEGETYRQAAVAFQGRGGPALLVISEPVERWDRTRVDSLLASIQ